MNPATALARLTVEALTAAGVSHVVLCPGSRSAPLAYALARVAAPGVGTGHATAGVLGLHVRHDERVAAFMALGVGLAGPTTGAVVTTSGTAAANLHPAVLEAHHANRRLVVVTADRPPVLRGTWANQTSELQADLFGDAVRARVDLDDAEAQRDPAAAGRRLVEALAVGRGRGDRRPGPVHLNLGFSEPLTPGSDAGVTVTAPGRPVNADRRGTLLGGGETGPRTVVLAGDAAGAQAQQFAEAAGLPLLAEPSSGARYGPNAIGPYRLLLEVPELGGAVEQAVVFGRPTLSRPVSRLLERPEVDVVLVSPYGGWPVVGRQVRRFCGVELEARQSVPSGPSGPRAADAWLARWRAAGVAASCAIDAVLDDDAAAGRLTGPLLAREVWAALGPDETLVAAASNPIRDLDLAAHPAVDGTPPAAVHAHRGLSGIDGTVSTALGVGLTGRRVRVLIGDVAFLHDAGALLAAPGELRPAVQVVVLNDDGGGIFGLLEYGALAETGPVRAGEFERLFGTPHGADLASLCRGYGVRFERVIDTGQLRQVLEHPMSGLSVVEVRADRAGLRELHARLRTAAHAAIIITTTAGRGRGG